MKKYCCLFWLLDPSGAHNSQDPSPPPSFSLSQSIVFSSKISKKVFATFKPGASKRFFLSFRESEKKMKQISFDGDGAVSE